MTINYDIIIPLRDGGTGSMGSVTDHTSNPDTGRYYLGMPGGVRRPFALVAVSLNFWGTTTGTADLRLYRQHRIAQQFLTERLWYAPARGIAATEGDADFWLRIAKDERDAWMFSADESLVLTWTNPGTIPWGLCVWVHSA